MRHSESDFRVLGGSSEQRRSFVSQEMGHVVRVVVNEAEEQLPLRSYRKDRFARQ